MRELGVLSGKDRTGKTNLVAAFASLAENKVLGDADVDASDLHLIMAPKAEYRSDFRSGNTAKIDKEQRTTGATAS
jgi:MinD superfamily P-loop ATPase